MADALSQGDLRAGQFLSIPQLVQTLCLPIAAVREAARHASTLGWLEIIPKRGVQILEVRSDTIRECLDLRMVLDQEGARRRIAEGADLRTLGALRAAHEKLLASAKEANTPALSPHAIKVDLSLHDFLADGLSNSLLRDNYESNRVRIAIIQRTRPFVVERIRSAMEEHLAIIDGLERRDTDAAIQALRYHCERTQHWWGV